MKVEDILNSCTTEISRSDLPPSNKAEICFNMIFMKVQENNQDIYLDTKLFLENYIDSVDSKKFGYDKINYTKINQCLELLQPIQRLSMFMFLKKCLIKHNLENDWNRFENNYHRCRNAHLTTKKFWFINPVDLLRFVYNKSVYSYWYLLLLLLLFLLFSFTILLPNNLGIWNSTFEVKYEGVSSNFYLNHMANILLGFFEIDSDFKIIPINFLGVFMLILGKLFKIIFVIKYAADKIKRKLSINE